MLRQRFVMGRGTVTTLRRAKQDQRNTGGEHWKG